MRFSSLATLATSTLVGVGALAVVIAPGALTHSIAQAQTPQASTTLHTASGDQVGSVTFTTQPNGILVDVTAQNLPPGFHGFHIHSVGQCDAPDFTSAGGHFDPMMMDNQPMHSGDLPPLLVNQDGSATLSVVTDRFSIDDLLTGAGTALIVHALPDNFANIPTRYVPAPDATTLSTGDAGARLACGVIQATS